MIAASSLHPITPVVLVAYAVLTGAAAVRVARAEGFVTDADRLGRVSGHASRAWAGFGHELVRAIGQPDWQTPPRLSDPESLTQWGQHLSVLVA